MHPVLAEIAKTSKKRKSAYRNEVRFINLSFINEFRFISFI